MMRVAVSIIVDDFNRENTNMDVGRVDVFFNYPYLYGLILDEIHWESQKPIPIFVTYV